MKILMCQAGRAVEPRATTFRDETVPMPEVRVSRRNLKRQIASLQACEARPIHWSEALDEASGRSNAFAVHGLLGREHGDRRQFVDGAGVKFSRA